MNRLRALRLFPPTRFRPTLFPIRYFATSKDRRRFCYRKNGKYEGAGCARRESRVHCRYLDGFALPIKILLSSKLNSYSNYYCGARWRRRVTVIFMFKKYSFFFFLDPSSSRNLYILRPVRDAHIKPLSVSLNTAVTYRS